tara:strand:- start:4017 stop:4823 length:807 start_codon:yes stop_codon:yes gene_type:complete
MGNTVISNPAIVDAATITAGSALANMPVTNLLRTQPKDRWRSDDLNNLYLVVDLGSAQAINLIALLFHNATQSATWRIRAATSEANLTAAPGYDSTAVNMWDATWPSDEDPVHSITWLGSSPETYQWWRIDVSDLSNPDNYFQVGRLYIDNAWQLPANKNIEYGWELRFIDPATKSRSKAGQLYAESAQRWRQIIMSINFQSEDEMYDNVYELIRRRGISKDIFVIRDPDATKHLIRQSIYGQLAQMPPIANTRTNIFRSRFIIEEMR